MSQKRALAQENLTWFTRPFLLVRGWGLQPRLTVAMEHEWGLQPRLTVAMEHEWGLQPRLTVAMEHEWGLQPRLTVAMEHEWVVQTLFYSFMKILRIAMLLSEVEIRFIDCLATMS